MIFLLRHTIFFEQTRLVELLTNLRMCLDPAVAKRIAHAPAVRVEVEGTETDVSHLQVCLPIYAFTKLVRIGTIARETEAFVADGDHVVWVKRTDVVTRLADPFSQDRRLAAITARLVGEFPRKHSIGVAIAGNDGFDVTLVHALTSGRCVPLCVAAYAAGGEVGGHTPIIGPVIHEVDYELDAVLFRSFDYSIQALETVCTCIYGGRGSGEGLEVYCARTRDGFDVVETPYSEYFLA